MRFNVVDLKKGFDLLKPGFNLNDLSEVGKYLFISGNDLFSYNGRLKIKYSMPVMSDLRTIALPVLEFGKLLSKLKGDIDIDVEGQIVNIKSGNTKAEFHQDQIILDKIKIIKEDLKNEWTAIPEKLLEGLKLCLFSVGKDMLKPISNIIIEKDFIASTDNFRLSLYNTKGIQEKAIFFPFDCVENLLKYSISEYQIKDNLIYFKTSDNLILSFSFSVDIKYPNIKPFIQDFSKIEGFDLIPDMADLIEIASIVSEKLNLIDRFIDVEVENGVLSITGIGDSGRIESSMKIESLKDKSFAFKINPVFFADIIKIKPVMKLKDNNMAVFEKDNFIHLFQIKPIEKKENKKIMDQVKEDDVDLNDIDLEGIE